MSEVTIHKIIIAILIVFSLVRCERSVNSSRTKLNKKEFKILIDSLGLKKKRHKVKEVVLVESIIKIDTFIKTQVIHDTIYISSIKDDFIDLDIEAKPDGTLVDLKIKPKYSVTFYQKKSLFKKHPLQVDIKDLSPYTTSEVKSYYYEPKKLQISHGLQLGVGVDLINKKPTVYAGYGLAIKF